MPDRVESMLERMRASLKAALDCYWPAIEGNEIAEVNPLFHLGHVLASEGYQVLGQVPEEGGGRIDLLAIRPDRTVGLVAEGKRLFNAQKAASMAADFRRMESLRLIDEYGSLQAHDAFFAVLIATTWGRNISDWWIDSERDSKPWRCRDGSGWGELRSVLTRCDRVGALRVWDDDPSLHQAVLFAVKTIPGAPRGYSTRK